MTAEFRPLQLLNSTVMARLTPRAADRAAGINAAGYSRRGGRAVDCAGLENRKAERPREFESHPLRV